MWMSGGVDGKSLDWLIVYLLLVDLFAWVGVCMVALMVIFVCINVGTFIREGWIGKLVQCRRITITVCINCVVICIVCSCV